MSNRYKGAVISATPPTTTGGEEGTASGAWTLEQQMQLQAAGLWPSPPPPIYVENVFNTGLYSATGGSETFSILGSVNMYTKGGLVWIKARTDAVGHYLIRPVTGASSPWNQSNGNGADGSFGTSEFRVNSNNTVTMSNGNINSGGTNYASWNFAKQPKFFDVVTWTGNNVNGRAISHALNSTPGMILVKCTSNSEAWYVWHRSESTKIGILNGTDAFSTNIGYYQVQEVFGNGTSVIQPTSTDFTVAGYGATNETGRTYVAYLFAHDAGGFGLTGTDNVISCGSYTGNGSATGPTVTLGYEPQWLLVKNASSALSWYIVDNMRGFPNGASLFPNDSTAESNALSGSIQINATGFTLTQNYAAINANGSNYIYIAIRRGPMAVPTLGTSVFSPSISSSTTANITSGFVTDLAFTFDRTGAGFGYGQNIYTRLQGNFTSLNTTTTNTEESNNSTVSFGQNNGIKLNGGTVYSTGYVYEQFQRAPSFCDVVCWSSTGSAQTINHNLGVVPELMIRRVRNGSWEGWMTYAAAIGNTKILYLNQTAGQDTNNGWNNQTPTATQFFVNNTLGGYNMVTYLFATCAGVSKVGSYTGTGAAQTINCGFTAGSRFVLIKRTDSTGDWYFWDSARGIIPSNDPYLLVNSAVAEVTGTDYVDTTNVGFDITSTAPAAINANGGTYIFLAIA